MQQSNTIQYFKTDKIKKKLVEMELCTNPRGNETAVPASVM